jgi:predicted phosphohydrolase
MNTIQVCSDIHLEKGDINKIQFNNIIIKNADILVLAGDIGNPFTNIYRNFIDYCSKLFIHVLIISGNHEYYYNDIYETDKEIDIISSKYTNVHYLNNRIFEYNKIIFVGTTLWSYIPNSTDKLELNKMKDYEYINDYNPNKCNELFKKNLNFIKDKINKYNNCIIITHHAPSYKCIPDKFKGDIVNCCFASELDELLENKNIIKWVYGHTHFNYINNVLFSNAYRSENYKINAIIKI